MNFPHFFIRRPIFAAVTWIILVIIGLLSYFGLPVEQYPSVVPPTVVVTASYPGASADTVAKTVATPLEQAVNGVENMLYMSSQSTGDGSMALTVTFRQGTDVDTAQVLVQNRVSTAEPRLPEDVRRRGVTTLKNSPDLMMVVNLFSPDGSYDQTYIANYANLQLRDTLSRIEGVGDIRLFGAGEYAMRVWVDPDRAASLGLSAGDVLRALQNQNVQVASGTLGQQPVGRQNAFELNVHTQGRLVTPEEFAEVIVKTGADGRAVKIKDIGRVELGADNYGTRGYLSDKKAVALPIFQRPGSNALTTAQAVKTAMEQMSQRFPKGLEYKIAYNPTDFVAASIAAVYRTIAEAVLLVVFVIILFLQSWRASIIPVIAIPASLIGTFAVMKVLGFSLNSLSLFALVLAIGIVVDDAIVVVENMERLMARENLTPREAAHRTMDEVGGALLAIGLVLIAVFLPAAFIGGIAGQFFRQFGVVIATATAFSVAVSLTLSPALAALWLKPGHGARVRRPWTVPFDAFNRFIESFSGAYGRLVGRMVRMLGLMLLIYAGLIALTFVQFNRVPTGFIPPQDQGYMIVAVQLPPGAALDRTDAVIRKTVERLLKIDGVTDAVGFAGFNGATFTSASNAGAIFPVLADFPARAAKGITFNGLMAQMQAAVSDINDAFIVVIPPPPVRGIGNGGGFKMMLQDRGGLGAQALNASVWQLAGAANQSGVVNRVFSFYETSTPELFVDVDRDKSERLGVPVERVYEALSIYNGSAYVNDFNYLGRTYRVTLQAEGDRRLNPEDLARLRVRNNAGDMLPLGTLATFSNRSGPSRQPRYNLYDAAELQGNAAPGRSTGEALQTMEALAKKVLPAGIDFEWTELAYQQKFAGNGGVIAFGLAVVFVFLLLAALYESWTLAPAILLIVPMCLLSAITGVQIAGMDNNILTQIGLLVLVGLAGKNAILIVEFAKEREAAGDSPRHAAQDAATLRLRPILMTSFAFILGVLPLVTAQGAGAEMRQALGVTVFSGMLGVTAFGLLFTPVFYVLCRSGRRKPPAVYE